MLPSVVVNQYVWCCFFHGPTSLWSFEVHRMAAWAVSPPIEGHDNEAVLWEGYQSRHCGMASIPRERQHVFVSMAFLQVHQTAETPPVYLNPEIEEHRHKLCISHIYVVVFCFFFAGALSAEQQSFLVSLTMWAGKQWDGQYRRQTGVREANVWRKVRGIPFKLCLKAKLCFVRYYPVASQMSTQLVLVHSCPGNLDYWAVHHLYSYIIRCSGGNCNNKHRLGSV